MLPLHLGAAAPLSVLALGAHADDVEIGCGGTLLRLARERPGLRAHLVVLSATPERAAEARASAAAFLAGAQQVTVEVHDLPDGRFPAVYAAAKQLLEQVAGRVDPALVLAPRTDDAHQDHRTLAGLVPTVWRDHLVLGYEVPKYDGDLGRPAAYVTLPDDVLARKCALLAEHYPSQAGRAWFDDEVFRGLARLRGVECRARYAEAFAAPKLVVGI